MFLVCTEYDQLQVSVQDKVATLPLFKCACTAVQTSLTLAAAVMHEISDHMSCMQLVSSPSGATVG